MNKLKCKDCEREFTGVTARRCKECRNRRLSMYAKERNLNKMGNEAYSRICAQRKATDERKERVY